MKIAAVLLGFACALTTARAQVTAFTYQGKLNNNGVAASGIYDLRFTIYDAVTNGNAVSVVQTNPSVAVSNGLFTVQLDFGATVFDGNARWLDIGVRTNGDVNPYTTLTPRQPITSTPYAIQAGNAASASVALFANNASSIAATNISGALTVAQLPSAVITNNATNVILTGTFSGVGTFKWLTVSGTNQQAANNTGYFVTNNAQATITLPTNSTPGDIVRVSCSGLGGWKMVQNAGQTILATSLLGNAAGAYWTARDTNRTWLTVASSDDGIKLVAGVFNGNLYTSTDSGATWIPRDSVRKWQSVASSADGVKLVAVVSAGQIYTSVDSGGTWTARETNRSWYAVASSSDGTKLVALDNASRIFTSTDSGANWTPRDSIRTWYGVASSADGSKLVAVIYNGQIYTSADYGVTWTPRESNRNWSSVASSADGTKLVAVVTGGQVYTSADSGVTWSAHDSNRQWFGCTSSADGMRLAATVYPLGQIYTSGDYGITWTARESNRSWFGIASSADGSKLVACSDKIYTSQMGTFPGTGYLVGPQYSAIELQYVGNGQWMTLSYVGTIAAY